MLSIIISGIGGQGALTAGLIVANAAIADDKNVTWIPCYGSEMRGGSANCSLKIGEGKIASPFVAVPDILVAMEQTSVDEYCPVLAKGSTVIVNTGMVSHVPRSEELRVIEVNASEISNGLKNKRGLNLVMLGALARFTDIFDAEALRESVEKYFADKGYDVGINSECYVQGYQQSSLKGDSVTV